MSAASARTGVRVRRRGLAVMGGVLIGVLFGVLALGAGGAAAAVAAMKTGQVITTEAVAAAEPLTLLSAAGAGAPRLSSAEAVRVAPTQSAMVVSRSGGGSSGSKPAKKRVSLASLGWAVLAVAVLAAAVATPLLFRRHRDKHETPP